jgi:hypothetical protein
MTGLKYDKEKLRVNLLYKDLVAPLEEITKVLTFGAKKYGDRNWEGVENERYVAAMMRHLNAYFKGEHYDEESGFPHLAHAGCCLLFIMFKEKYGGRADE